MALLVPSGLVALIYWPTLRLAFVSDAWVYLERLQHGAWAAVATPVGYHWQPVGCAWVALLRGVFGERPALFQAVNLMQLALVGYLTFELGRRLLADYAAALLASLLVVGSAAFYEVSYWPLAGNMHLLAALLYILSTVIAYDVASGRLGRGGPWLLGLAVLAAVFSHPAMVTSLVTCALLLLVVARRRPGRESGAPSTLRALQPLVAVAVLFVLARIVFHSFLDIGPRPSLEPVRLVWLVRSGLLPVLSLRGSILFLDRLLGLGTRLESPSETWAFVGAWLAAAAVGAVLCFRRACPDGVRLLAAFLAIHLVALAVAGGTSPRQTVVPSVPAALLTAWVLRASAAWLATRATTPVGAAVASAVPVVVVALLIAAAQVDHRTALLVHTRASAASRALVARLAAVAPPAPFELALINMPAAMAARGIGSFAFGNGLGELAHLTAPSVTRVHLWRLPIRGAPERIVEEIPVLGWDGLRAQFSDPRRVILLYDDETVTVRALTLADVEPLTARAAP